MFPEQFGDAVTANQIDSAASGIERLIGLGIGAYSAVNQAKAEKASGVKSLQGQTVTPAAPGFQIDNKALMIGGGLLVAALLVVALRPGR